ncbi:hypothetical protein F5Y17DRAFT_346868 [Xylariaceae sp. FL0594]|nr:hypothetical protein F5Y17DRAFT_346868 [Xylariaceae sp. FL0594]
MMSQQPPALPLPLPPLPKHQHPPEQHHQQPPRGVALEDPAPIIPLSHRRNNSQFDSHDDFYAFLDSNRAPSMSMAAPGPNVPVASDRASMSSSQAPILQQPQRNPAPGHARPPVSTYGDRSRPPSYSGSRSDEGTSDRSARIARQNVRRGAPTKPPPSGPRPRASSPTPPVSGGSSPTHPRDGSRPVSSPVDPEAAGASIQRLRSPTVIDCVLQPLEAKVREYQAAMQRQQDDIKRLDEELEALQARRAEAEGRFSEAKAKHDEYKRQYNDVERALSGDVGPLMSPALQQQQQQQQQRPTAVHGPGSVAGSAARPPTGANHPQQGRFGDHPYDDDMDDDDRSYISPPYGAPSRRIQSQQSFGQTSQKKERFRFSSLFGGR